MANKNKKDLFKNINPNDVLSGSTPKKEPRAAVEPSKSAPEEPEPQRKKSPGKKGQKYLRLDITNYQDYIALMAEHMTNTSGKYTSMTQYILSLIEADKQSNLTLYQKLAEIENMKKELV